MYNILLLYPPPQHIRKRVELQFIQITDVIHWHVTWKILIS